MNLCQSTNDLIVGISLSKAIIRDPYPTRPAHPPGTSVPDVSMYTNFLVANGYGIIIVRISQGIIFHLVQIKTLIFRFLVDV